MRFSPTVYIYGASPMEVAIGTSGAEYLVIEHICHGSFFAQTFQDEHSKTSQSQPSAQRIAQKCACRAV